MNDGDGTPREKLNELVGRGYRPDEVAWLESDLDGNGDNEFILVRGVQDDHDPVMIGQGAALFVIYRKDGHWAVDRTDPIDELIDHNLMSPHLHAVADLAGTGHPQIVWSRPEMIATGPQPFFVFVTSWKPGVFTQLPGQMALSNFQLKLDGRDLLLSGVIRNQTYLPVLGRTDRYRFVDGAFRLVDRRFNEHPEDAHARLWDGLVAEDTRRVADAVTAYREATDPVRPGHSGTIFGYNTAPRALSEADLARFGEALRTFARFRLGTLLLQDGRGNEAAATLTPDGGVYDGLLAAARQTPDRGAACTAAQSWASANPEFLKALNIGVGTSPWTPELLCAHIDINDHGFWER